MPDPSEPSDDVLMARVADGDRTAFEVLVNRHLDAIYRYAYRLCRAAADADDIAQEVFLKVWRRAETYTPGRVKLTTWLHRLAHNTFVDAARRNQPAVSLEEYPQPEREAPPAEAGSNQLDALINALPFNQRTALALCSINGHSTAEAAEILGASPRAVESLLARARRKLRKQLKEV